MFVFTLISRRRLGKGMFWYSVRSRRVQRSNHSTYSNETPHAMRRLEWDIKRKFILSLAYCKCSVSGSRKQSSNRPTARPPPKCYTSTQPNRFSHLGSCSITHPLDASLSPPTPLCTVNELSFWLSSCTHSNQHFSLAEMSSLVAVNYNACVQQ